MKFLKILIGIALLQGIGFGSVTQGIEWLESVQDTQGFWADSFVNSYQATYTVLETFNANSKVDLAFYRGLEWFEGYSLQSVDHRARYLRVLSLVQADTLGLRDSLLLFKNPDGGFGIERDFESDNWDTYLALLSLYSSGYQNTEILQSIIGFFVSQQDSGWRIMDKSVLVTAKVLFVLEKYQNIFNLSASLEKSLTWLINRQGENGSFGEGTIYETAFSLLSLLDSDRDFTIQISSAVQFLIAEQDTNGSWNNSPYETALAIWAFSKIKPNLILTEVFADTLYPIEGDTVSLFAVVQNTGASVAESVLVRFYDGIPDSGYSIGEVIISSLEPFDEDTVTVQYLTQGKAGLHSIFAVADPENEIAESNEQDNQNSFMLRVIGGYDLEIADISFSPEYPAPDRPFTITAEVYNWSGVLSLLCH